MALQNLDAISKMTEQTWFVHLPCFQGKPFHITVIKVYAPSNAEEAEVEQFYEDLQDLLELTPKKKISFSS